MIQKRGGAPTQPPRWRTLHVNLAIYAALILVLFLGAIESAKLAGVWSTSGKLTASGEQVQITGADPAVILFGFVFLVALGIDYNIFLMTRVREETGKIGVHDGTIKALVVTGGVITSAGTVLAATFAALGVIPILFLAQIAFIVAFGVLLDTVIVRSLLVPSLTLEIGKAMWWPSKLSHAKGKK